MWQVVSAIARGPKDTCHPSALFILKRVDTVYRGGGARDCIKGGAMGTKRRAAPCVSDSAVGRRGGGGMHGGAGHGLTSLPMAAQGPVSVAVAVADR